MNQQAISTIVIGGLNTDLIAKGAKKLLQPGELTYAEELHIGPGGKSRNIAQMIAKLSDKKNVAMIGKTSQDPYGLWKVPLDSLKSAGVNTDYISITSYEKSKQFPGIALIPVDTEGKNQIYVIPGINNSFSPSDIEKADDLFQIVAQNSGIFVATLELPYETAVFAMRKASKLGIRILFDPGGIEVNRNYGELLSQNIFLIKPNEHEAKILTGTEVTNYETAKKAAKSLLQKGIQNVFITIGAQGGYFFNKTGERHISIPNVKNTSAKDETGCGDETMAAIADSLSHGDTLHHSLEVGILAGTLQFHKLGIDPITKGELNKYLL